MHLKYCKLKIKTINFLLEHFIAGTPARTAADLAGININSAVQFYHRIRQVIYFELSQDAAIFDGEIEVDESYFGGRRKGKRGRGAGGKVAVFGLLKRGDKVYTAVIDNAKSSTLLPIIRSKIKPDSVIVSDTFRSYDTLDISEFHHKRVNHTEEYVAKDGSHINGIENFWSQAKRHLRKYNGIPRQHFPLFLKECEFRFNGGSPSQLLTKLKLFMRRSYGKILKIPHLGTMLARLKDKPAKAGASRP
jgi:transposase